MCAGWRQWRALGGRRLAALAVIGVLGVVGTVGAAGPAAVASDGSPTPSMAQLSSALSGLRAQGEVLTERYDHEVALEQQAAAAYRVAAARLAAARSHERRAVALLAQLAVAEYESSAGQSMAEVLFAGITDPQGYLGTLGFQQTLDNHRVDLLAASKADEIVTRLFSEQAATLLAQQRSAAQSAGFLKAAVIAAVDRQAAVVKAAVVKPAAVKAAAVKAAVASRSRLASKTAAAPSSTPASVLAGGPAGAAPGVVAPAWASDAGASVAQGNVAANWALSQLGKPYQWGAAGPNSYDCSGLALQAWARAGVRLLHWTGFQWVSGPHVPLAELRRGDLVFFATNTADPATIHHVGIYIGHGLMVDAPYTGAFVEIDSIYAVGGLIGATRPAA
jgi:cell wall-associated NlpC family hydrolase